MFRFYGKLDSESLSLLFCLIPSDRFSRSTSLAVSISLSSYSLSFFFWSVAGIAVVDGRVSCLLYPAGDLLAFRKGFVLGFCVDYGFND
jgi:hypothetical protein